MSYEQYALILAQEHRQRHIAEAAEHRLGHLHHTRRPRRPVLRPVGRLLVRMGRALGADPAIDVDPTGFQPARSR